MVSRDGNFAAFLLRMIIMSWLSFIFRRLNLGCISREYRKVRIHKVGEIIERDNIAKYIKKNRNNRTRNA